MFLTLVPEEFSPPTLTLKSLVYIMPKTRKTVAESTLNFSTSFNRRTT
jgi:hypothetical protein